MAARKRGTREVANARIGAGFAARAGATAADLLLTRIGRDASPPRHIVLAPDLVARGSGEVAPA